MKRRNFIKLALSTLAAVPLGAKAKVLASPPALGIKSKDANLGDVSRAEGSPVLGPVDIYESEFGDVAIVPNRFDADEIRRQIEMRSRELKKDIETVLMSEVPDDKLTDYVAKIW